MDYWLNVDKPNGECLAHEDGCRHPAKWTNAPTAKKPVGPPLGVNGGWLKFSSIAAIKKYWRKHHRSYSLQIFCTDCP